MKRTSLQAAALLLSVVTFSACSSGGAVPAPTMPAPQPANSADVEFMTGMIPHHAQAVLISKWAPTHGASEELQRMCERIVVSQSQEIGIIQGWLREKGRPVPPSDATHHRMTMGGMTHDMLMPGMLTPEELAKLDAARGNAFDKLFLEYMIKHHNGAVSMVDELIAKNGGGSDELVFKMAGDIYADQTTEVDRMQKMLAARSQ
ncbi:MAG: DUF305 domain-containing protein [Gemmatimonadota bacterium]